MLARTAPLARDELVLRHRWLAKVAARRWAKSLVGYGRDDLEQEALLEMLRAAPRFDPERGVKFSTFAMRAIENRFRFLYDTAGPISVSRHITRLCRQTMRSACGPESLHEASTRVATEHAPSSRKRRRDMVVALRTLNALERVTLARLTDLVLRVRRRE